MGPVIWTRTRRAALSRLRLRLGETQRSEAAGIVSPAEKGN